MEREPQTQLPWLKPRKEKWQWLREWLEFVSW